MHNRTSIIAGKDLDRYFDLHQALLEFGMLFEQETNGRAIAIVGAAFLDTLLGHILSNFSSIMRKRCDNIFACALAFLDLQPANWRCWASASNTPP